MNIIDITGTIKQGMWNYDKPFPPINIQQYANLENDGFNGHVLSFHNLTGTYLETADHLINEREQIADVEINRLINNNTWIAHLSDKQALEPIGVEEFKKSLEHADLKSGDALLVATGWDAMWDKSNYASESPFFLPETMKWIIEKDVALLGVDIPSIEDPRPTGKRYNQLKQFYAKKDRLLLAPISNLRETKKIKYTLTVLPLKISDVCASPCRAILTDI